MSKITNNGLTRSGTGCFIAVSIMATVGRCVDFNPDLGSGARARARTQTDRQTDSSTDNKGRLKVRANKQYVCCPVIINDHIWQKHFSHVSLKQTMSPTTTVLRHRSHQSDSGREVTDLMHQCGFISSASYMFDWPCTLMMSMTMCRLQLQVAGAVFRCCRHTLQVRRQTHRGFKSAPGVQNEQTQ